LALEAQQVQVEMAALVGIQYFQPLPLQAAVMAAATKLLAVAAVRAVAAVNLKLVVPAIHHLLHHHRETMVAQHLLQQAVVAVAAVVQARLAQILQEIVEAAVRVVRELQTH
jgi:hypothetical protein